MTDKEIAELLQDHRVCDLDTLNKSALILQQKRSIGKVTDITRQQSNKKTCIQSRSTTSFMPIPHHAGGPGRERIPTEQVQNAYELEFQARQEKIEALQEEKRLLQGNLASTCATYFHRKEEWGGRLSNLEGEKEKLEQEMANLQWKHNNGHMAYQDLRSKLNRSESLNDALQIKTEELQQALSSERDAGRAKQVEELEAALAAKERELKCVKEASTGRETKLEQQLQDSLTILRDRDQEVSAINDRVVACCTQSLYSEGASLLRSELLPRFSQERAKSLPKLVPSLATHKKSSPSQRSSIGNANKHSSQRPKSLSS